MVSQKVVNYLQKGKKRGFSYQRLKQELLKSGFKEKTVNDAVNYLKQGKTSEAKKKAVKKKTAQKKISQKKPSKKSVEEEFTSQVKQQKPETPAKKVQDKKEGKKSEKEKKKIQDKKEKLQKKEEKGVSNKNLKKIPKKRKAGIVLLLSIITLGIYGIVWLVKTTKELRANTETAPKPSTLWLFLIPVVNFVVPFIYFWKYSAAINELTGFSKGGLFALWIFLGPVAMVVSQVQLNKLAKNKV